MSGSLKRENSFVLFADSNLGGKVSAILAEHKASVKAIVLREGLDRDLEESILFPWQATATKVLFWSPEKPDGGLLQELSEISFEIGFLAWWPYILSDRIISLARGTFLNMHPSLLPYGRGKDPNFWAFVDKTPFGVTIHHVVRSVDRGPIAFQEAIPVEAQDTGGTLYKKAVIALENLFQQVCGRVISGDIPSLPQPEAGTFHKRSELHLASQIHLDKMYQAEDLISLLRARTFLPHPGCWFEHNGKRYEVRILISEQPS